MKKEVIKGVALWKFAHLEGKNIRHFVSGKTGGVSPAPWDSLNLSFSAGDANENVLENRARLAAAMDLPADALVFVSQCHSADVAIIRGKGDSKGVEADAMVTNVPGICICVMGADCVPVLAYNPVKKVAAAIHAGWRGTASSITQKALTIMHDLYKCEYSDIIVAIGPSISQEKYEVGGDVYEAFAKSQPENVSQIFKKDLGSGKYFPDLWLANRLQALKLGVREDNIEISGICTFSNPNEFFSARYFKNKTGRFAAGIAIQ